MDLVLAVLSGVVASFIFLLVLRSLRPKILISNVIAVSETEGEKRYEIKIINKSRREAVDLRAELLLVNSEKVIDGVVQNHENLRLTRNSLFIVPSYSAKDEAAKYAIRFTIAERLEERWLNDKCQNILFRIYCRDETSGFGKAFSKEYKTKAGSLVRGSFHSGNSVEVSEIENA